MNYHVWKRVLPRQEIATHGGQSHCHTWLTLKQCHVQSLVLRKHTVFTVLKLIYTVLLTPRNCHAWRSKPLPHPAKIKAMPRAVNRVEETHYTHCFEAYLYSIINWQFVFYRYGRCTLSTVPWFSAAVNLNFCCLQLQYNVIYQNNNFTRHFFMIVSK